MENNNQVTMKGLCSLMVLLLLVFNSCCAKNKASQQPIPELTRVVEKANCKALVFDKVFGRSTLNVVEELLRRYAPWDYVYPENYEGMKSNDNGDMHWVASFSPKMFTTSKIWKLLKHRLPKEVFNGQNYFPYEANGVLLNRGDFPTVQKGKNNGDLLIRIMLTSGLKKNDYSEMVFYDSNEEICGSIHQRFGRVIVWNDTADFIFKPPCINHATGEYSIFIKATLDQNKYDDSLKEFKMKADERNRMAKEPFPLTNMTDDSISKINFTNHLTRKFTDSHNRTIAVFDDVIPKHVLSALREYFFKYDSSYVYNPYDSDHEEQTDNVNWVAQALAERLPPSLVWQYVKSMATYLSGESNWHPYDVSMNIIQHVHNPRIHEDSAVVPKFGRVAMFRNIIPHSARPSSPDFLASRYTFAVKIGRNPQIATGKKLRELLGDFGDDGDKKRARLMQDLGSQKYDKGNDKLDFLEKKYLYYKKKKENMDFADKNRYYKLLSMELLAA
eukprot:gene15087-16643_t